MKKIYLFLTLLVYCLVTNASELNINLSGFVTATAFGDEKFYPNKANAALNIDIVKDYFAIRTQLAIPYDRPVRRLVLEKSSFIRTDEELTIQLGRFPRLDSFYNSVTDSPGTTGLAMLPPAEYNRRIIENRGFNSIDGLRAIYSVKTDNGIVDYHLNYGLAAVEDKCGIQVEFTKRTCSTGHTFESQDENYGIGFSTDYGRWKTLGFVTNFKVKSVLLDSTNKTSVGLFTNMNKINYFVYKVGVKYEAPKWWAQSTYMYTDLNFAKPNMGYVNVQVSDNIYLLTGIKWYSNFNTYVEYSYGKSNTGRASIDRAIGTTYIKDDITYSLEYHKGDAIAWKRYFSPTPEWDTWVMSITKRF